MKKAFLIIGLFLTFSFAITSCDKKNKNDDNKVEEKESMEEKVVFTCPMHPEVISDKAEKCPKCGMDLVEKETEHTNEEHHDHADSSKSH